MSQDTNGAEKRVRITRQGLRDEPKTVSRKHGITVVRPGLQEPAQADPDAKRPQIRHKPQGG